MPKTDELRAYKILATASSTLAKSWYGKKRISTKKLDSITACELYTALSNAPVLNSQALQQIRGYFIRVCVWNWDGTADQISNRYFGNLESAVDNMTTLTRKHKEIPNDW